jgi:hypothetical protein
MMTPQENVPLEKKPYDTPTLTIHGDVEAVTLGDDLGESVDAAFTTTAHSPRGTKQPKVPIFS